MAFEHSDLAAVINLLAVHDSFQFNPAKLRRESTLRWQPDCPAWLANYTAWHAKSLREFSEGTFVPASSIRFMLHQCTDTQRAHNGCPGIGDRLRGLMETLAWAVHTRRTFLLRWEAAAPLEAMLAPASLDWRVLPGYRLDALSPGESVEYRWLNKQPVPHDISSDAISRNRSLRKAKLLAFTHPLQGCIQLPSHKRSSQAQGGQRGPGRAAAAVPAAAESLVAPGSGGKVSGGENGSSKDSWSSDQAQDGQRGPSRAVAAMAVAPGLLVAPCSGGVDAISSAGGEGGSGGDVGGNSGSGSGGAGGNSGSGDTGFSVRASSSGGQRGPGRATAGVAVAPGHLVAPGSGGIDAGGDVDGGSSGKGAGGDSGSGGNGAGDDSGSGGKSAGGDSGRGGDDAGGGHDQGLDQGAGSGGGNRHMAMHRNDGSYGSDRGAGSGDSSVGGGKVASSTDGAGSGESGDSSVPMRSLQAKPGRSPGESLSPGRKERQAGAVTSKGNGGGVEGGARGYGIKGSGRLFGRNATALSPTSIAGGSARGSGSGGDSGSARGSGGARGSGSGRNSSSSRPRSSGKRTDRSSSGAGSGVRGSAAGIAKPLPLSASLPSPANQEWHAKVTHVAFVRKPLPGPDIGCATDVPPHARSCLFRALFRPSPRLSRFVSGLRNQLFGSSSAPYVAVHLRLGGFEGEKTAIHRFGANVSEAVEVARSLAAAHALAAARRISAPVLVITDNALLRQALQEGRLPGFVSPSYAAAHISPGAARGGKAVASEEVLRQAQLTSFADLALLAGASCLIGSRSGFSHTALMWGRHSCFLLSSGAWGSQIV